MSTSQNKHQDHNLYMKLALDQASRSLGNTKENPAVGCVIVKNNNLIGAGFTSINGRPHAEQNAINFSRINTKNCHLYVTLEPCAHYGKTPPCIETIIKKKIKKVFFSICDPDFRTFDKSTQILRKNGIMVNRGILNKETKFFYRSYLKFKKELLPFVTCKLAISKDFYTINKKKNKWITNEFSRGRVHLMRSNHDCIMTSSSTVVNDNPRLTCRIKGLNYKSPSRIILDKELKISVDSKVVNEAKNYNTIIFYNKLNKKKIKLLQKLKIRTFTVPLGNDGHLDLRKSLITAKQLGFSRIFLESGIKLSTSFLNKNLIDDFKLFISNKKLGGNGKANIERYIKNFFKKRKKIVEKINLFGDKLMSYELK